MVTDYTPKHQGQGIFGQADTSNYYARSYSQEGTQSDLLILELRNDFIMKLAIKPNQGSEQYQVKVELNEIDINLETRLIQDLLEYHREIQKIYYYRHIDFKKFLKMEFKDLKQKIQRKVLSFGHINELFTPGRTKSLTQKTFNLDPQPAGPLKTVTEKSEKSKSNPPSQNKIPSKVLEDSKEKDVNDSTSRANDAHAHRENIIEPPPVDFTELFLVKLEEFIQYHEILVSMNLDPINFNLCENTHSLTNRVDLLGVQLPKGKIVLSFNYNKKNINVVDFYGFKLETSSRFQALYYLVKVIESDRHF